MRSYDDYLAQKTDEYMQGCKNYKCEITIEEYCKYCETYCENYLETLSLDEIEADLKEQEEYYSDFIGNYLPVAIKKAEQRIKLLKEFIRGVKNEQ